MAMIDLSELIPIGFIFGMMFGAVIFILDFKVIPYLIHEVEDSYRSLSERIWYLILTIVLIFAPFYLWYNAYNNSPFYEIFPLGFFDFCILLIVGVPLLFVCMYLYEISNRG